MRSCMIVGCYKGACGVCKKELMEEKKARMAQKPVPIIFIERKKTDSDLICDFPYCNCGEDCIASNPPDPIAFQWPVYQEAKGG